MYALYVRKVMQSNRCALYIMNQAMHFAKLFVQQQKYNFLVLMDHTALVTPITWPSCDVTDPSSDRILSVQSTDAQI